MVSKRKPSKEENILLALIIGPFLVLAFIQVLWTFGALAVISYVLQLIATIRYRWHDLSPEYLIEMGFVSVVGAIPATQGFLSHAWADAIQGFFLSALIWVVGYIFVTKIMDQIGEEIKSTI